MYKFHMKIAVVTSGGGMSCSYSAGALLALVEHYKFVNPYIMVGGSGSSGSLAYYASQQYSSIRKIWTKLLSSKQFISYMRPLKVIDIDFLVDAVFKKMEPLDINSLRSSPIKLFISVVNTETGDIEYLSNKDNIDLFEGLRASAALPIGFNKVVIIKGKTYIDGAVGSSFNNYIEKALEEGADAIIAIDTEDRSRLNRLLSNLWSYSRKQSFRKGLRSRISSVNCNSSVIILKPSVKLSATLMNNSMPNLKETFEIGYKDVIENGEIMKLMEKRNAIV